MIAVVRFVRAIPLCIVATLIAEMLTESDPFWTIPAVVVIALVMGITDRSLCNYIVNRGETP